MDKLEKLILGYHKGLLIVGISSSRDGFKAINAFSGEKADRLIAELLAPQEKKENDAQ